jgi:hypothetical protein
MMTADYQNRDQAKATIIQKPAEFSIERFTIKPGTLFKFPKSISRSTVCKTISPLGFHGDLEAVIFAVF